MHIGKHVPVELRQQRQWVAAAITPDPARPGKSNKRPVDPHTGKAASTTDPATWGTFEEALRMAEGITAQGKGAAVGFVFTAGDPYTGIDFDECYDELRNLDPQIKRWVDELDSYTEASLSRKGLHVIVKGQLPPGGRRKSKVEMYDRSRFFVMTGERVFPYPADVNERAAALAQMHAEVFGDGLNHGLNGLRDDTEVAPSSVESVHPSKSVIQTLADDEVLLHALGARNGRDFEALWLGRATDYGSASEADFALACRLAFWTGGDLAQMDRLFRRSGLVRPKWDEKHYGNGKTYGQTTLERALAQTTEFYGRSLNHGWTGLPDDTDRTPCSVESVHPSESVTQTSMPLLPDGALVDPAPGKGAAPWLDEFVAHVRTCLPWAYEEYAVAAGLHVLSTVAARRVLVNAGGKQFTNLYLVLVGPSSYAGKSRTARLGLDMIESAGLSCLRAPDQMTPQAFVKRANARLSPDWKKRGSPDKWAEEKLKAAFAGQSGWFYDEFGSFIVQILNDNGPMQGFRPMLKEFDNCPLRYESDTITRDVERIEHPYLTILAAMTPGQFGKARRKFGELAEDGFWARFAFVAPPPGWIKPVVRAPKDPPPFPARLVLALADWHHRLGIPEVEEVELAQDDAVAGDGLPQAKAARSSAAERELRVRPKAPKQLILADDVYEAYNRYREGLEEVALNHGEEIAGSYSRQAERTMRVAALLASMQGDRLEMRHWAYAQGVAERWRQGLHWALEAASASAVAPDVEQENKIVSLLQRKGPMTAAEMRRYLSNMGSTTLKLTLDALAKVGEIGVVQVNQKGNPVYAAEMPA